MEMNSVIIAACGFGLRARLFFWFSFRGSRRPEVGEVWFRECASLSLIDDWPPRERARVLALGLWRRLSDTAVTCLMERGEAGHLGLWSLSSSPAPDYLYRSFFLLLFASRLDRNVNRIDPLLLQVAGSSGEMAKIKREAGLKAATRRGWAACAPGKGG